MPSQVLGLVAWATLAGLGCALFTGLALHYARARQLLDLPGRRRSHAIPTLRGGGVAIVLTLLIALALIHWRDVRLPLLVAAALVLVAGIGWLDDHRPQPVRRRLLVHVLAGSGLALLLLGLYPNPLPAWPTFVVAALATFWLVGCINTWNFMDGSNGLLTSQCLWLGLALALWFPASASGHGALASPWALLALTLAAACAGFLPFNFPRAVIFLGDVGSGALGLVCGLLLLVAAWLAPERIWLLLLLPSALLVDATATLLWRILAGRRWYTAHREHLYQWLIRSGRSHAQVAVLYMGWNLFMVLPVCLVLLRWPSAAMPLGLAVLGLAAGLWWLAKRSLYAQCMQMRRARRQVHEQGSYR